MSLYKLTELGKTEHFDIHENKPLFQICRFLSNDTPPRDMKYMQEKFFDYCVCDIKNKWLDLAEVHLFVARNIEQILEELITIGYIEKID